MLSCDINHPQSEDFATAKSDLTKVTGANISVKIDDAFMNKIEIHEGLPEITKNNKEVLLWKQLVHQAWKTAEPGVLFWDTIVRESPADCYEGFKSTSTNPCGEIPLCPYDSCRLLSINLTKFVDNPFTPQALFNWERFKHVVYIAQKIMDDVVDLEEEKINAILKKIENDPEPEEIKVVEKNLWLKIKVKLLDGRRTGLSGIGLADCLASLNKCYSDGNSITLAEEIYKTLAIIAYKSSIDMAKDRGAFSIWDKTKEEDNPFISRIVDEIVEEELYGDFVDGYYEGWLNNGRRNIALLTIPPSGTISLLAGISSGIEPVYQLNYKRRRKVNPEHPNISFTDVNGDCWEEYVVYHSGYKNWFDMAKHGDINPYHGSTAYELNPLDRVKMQGTIQKWVDHSISSTINLPKEATEEDVANIYMEAWKQGCKGITIYVDGSRDGVLISNEVSQKDDKFVTNNAPKRPKVLLGDLYAPTIHGNDYIVVIGLYDNKPYEVFACKNTWNIKGKYACSITKQNRGVYDVDIKDKIYINDITSEMTQVEESTTRLVSTSLRHGADIKFLVEQLLKARGNGFQDFSKVIARKLKNYIQDNEKVTGAVCESCGSSNLVYEGGCSTCKDCGSSKCS